MFDPYVIRSARRKDLYKLPSIERDAARRFGLCGIRDVGPAVSLEVLERRQHSGQLWVVLDRADTPVGFAAACVVDGHAHLDEVHVLVEHGRRGLGARLVMAVCRWAKRSRLREVTLSTLRAIPWNAPFYARLGFEIVPEEELTEAMKRLRRLEARAGLQVAERVIMRRRV
jgi:GNAT superfamily N-acetyltransferase